jgi:hypothetical protein
MKKTTKKAKPAKNIKDLDPKTPVKGGVIDGPIKDLF